MSPTLAGFLLAGPASAEVVLRNDRATDDRFDTDDALVWMEYPECAVAVLEPDEGDLPLTIDEIRVYLGSSAGDEDRVTVTLNLAMDVLEPGETPRIKGVGKWAFEEETFYAKVSSENLVGLSLDQPEAGIYPFTLTGGALAVFICTSDPDFEDDPGIEWPWSSPKSASGIVIETTSPSAGSWFIDGRDPVAVPLSDRGIEGAWVIRAVSHRGGDDGDTASDTAADDTAGDDTAGAVDGLRLDDILPHYAYLGGPVDVTIYGDGFTEGAEVFIGGLPVADLAWSSGSRLTGRSPSGLPSGTHDLLILQGDESATLPEVFDVYEQGYASSSDDIDGGCCCFIPAIVAPLGLLGLAARKRVRLGR